jgi:hypothetical protein
MRYKITLLLSGILLLGSSVLFARNEKNSSLQFGKDQYTFIEVMQIIKQKNRLQLYPFNGLFLRKIHHQTGS